MKNKNLKDLNNCWLSPSGEVITEDSFTDCYVEYGYHEDIGFWILQKLWNLDFMQCFEKVQYKNLGNTATEELEDLGYIRLHGFGGLTPVWIIPCNYKLTKKQENLIVDWSIENGREYESCFAK